MMKSWCLRLLCFGLLVLPGKDLVSQYIYWVDASFHSPTLNRSDLSGGNITTVPLSPKSLPEAMAIDAVRNMVYFGELAYFNANVNNAHPNLSNIVAISTGGSVIRGIAIDAAASKIYWTTSNLTTGATIEKADLGGTNRQTVYQFGPGSGTNLRGIAVDGTILYWADFGSGKILRGDVAGSTTPSELIADLDGPVGVSLGNDGYLYWTEANAKVIKRRASISGTITTLVSGLTTPNYIAVDGASGQMFWTESGTPRIRKADVNGANVQTLPLAVAHPTGIAATSSPLPVKLVSFVATVQDIHVLLGWRTLSEVNNYGFMVQRRHEGETVWTELPKSFVPGHGTTTVPHDYAFADSSPAPGNNAYRLKQVDTDGTEYFSASVNATVVTALRAEKPLAFELDQNYPNPFNPSTMIRYALPYRSNVSLIVFNTLGQQFAVLQNGEQEAGYHEVKCDASGLSSGVYFYRITAGSFVDTKRLLLMR